VSKQAAIESASRSEAEPRERILDAARELFSAKGYSAVGVRELAARACVNIAMISYYFGSKQGVLEELINRFFDLYEAVATEVAAIEADPERRVRAFVRRVVALFRDNPRLVRIAMIELPLDATDLAELKADRLRRFVQGFHSQLHKSKAVCDPQVAAIRGPALMAMLASHFLMKPVLERMGPVVFDEAFYAKLPEVLADLFLAGARASVEADARGSYADCCADAPAAEE